MIEKRIDHPLSDHGLHSRVLTFSEGNALEKVARDNYIPPSLDKAIREIQSSPDPSMVYLYDRALGAGEIYGPNNNGDFFSKSDLKSHHDSFVKSARLYRHHKSNGPNIGDVMASAYNEKLDTVDLIIRAPLEKVASDVEKLDNGFILATSMGARLKYDVCSYCGNRASRRSLYCPHLKYNMLKMYPDGRQVYAINPSPKFVDISLVVIPAAPESAILRKIASKRSSIVETLNSGIIAPARGVINPLIVEKTANLNRRDLIMTIDSVKGPLRPDEFCAIMRKDASIINPDIVPYVGYKRVAGRLFEGNRIEKLASAIDVIPDLPLSSNKMVFASFMDHDEMVDYLNYRKLSDSRVYIR